MSAIRLPLGRGIPAVLAVLTGISTAWGAAPAQPAAAVPDKVLQQIEGYFRPPGRPASREEYDRMVQQYARQMDELLKAGEQAEKEYPKAANLHLVRVKMLEAADFLVRTRKTDAARAQRLAVAGRLAPSDAPPEARVQADYFVTLDGLKPPTGSPPPDAGKRVRDYVARYQKTPAEAAALVRAADLARQASQAALLEELLGELDKDHARDGAVHAFLRQAGRKPPFYAKLALLDGKELNLPDDLLGKVVVVDFWATWCPPCRAYLPKMKEFYARYKGKGVEFLGISLDKANGLNELQEFIKTNDIGWLHTYSGKYWDDPTARHYGIGGIPSVWVIGRDGRVVSDDARGDLPGAIEQALAAPATAPAGARSAGTPKAPKAPKN